MKNIRCTSLFCVVALLGLPLIPVSASTAAEEEKTAPAANSDTPKEAVAALPDCAPPAAAKDKAPTAREAKHAADLARYDVDKDGKLNADERAAKKADADKARADKKAARDAKRAEKTAAAEAKKLARYDLNKDGKLDEKELAAAKADQDKRDAAAAKRKAARSAGTASTAAPQTNDSVAAED